MIPLYTTSQIRSVDAYSINHLKIPSIVLMENAARSICEILSTKFELNGNSRIAILCGKGNNGGDGFAVARHLLNLNCCVKVLHFFAPEEFSPDTKTNFDILKKMKSDSLHMIRFRSKASFNAIRDCNFVIDAMLGSGSKGELREPYSSAVDFVNFLHAAKIAIDQPTGLDADTGFAYSVFHADCTITLANFKRGLFFSKGYEICGEVLCGSIGTDDSLFSKLNVEEYLVEPEDVQAALPKKNKALNKYSSGKTLSIAGSGKYPGAAMLTAVSALKVGCGASIIAFPNSIKSLIHKKYPELVSHHYNDNASEYFSIKNLYELEEKINWADCVAIGPGLGREAETEEGVHQILNRFNDKFIVLDADALYFLRGRKYKHFDLTKKILTPHLGEFSLMLGIEKEEIEKDLLLYGRKFVRETQSHLVLKGPRTITFLPGGEAIINSSGNVGLAKFGAGDVLTGVIAGLLSQSKNLEDACIVGNYLHGLSADLLARKKSIYSFTASEVMENLSATILFLKKSFNG